MRSWCHETVAKDWQKFRSTENYNKLAYNTEFPWMADGKNGEISMNYGTKNQKGEWEVLRLYTFQSFKDGIYRRDAVLETDSTVRYQLADIPLPNGILRVDKVSVSEPTEIRGRYGVVIEKGVGVFNGDTGILREINEFAETAEVEFEDGRFAMYSFKQLEELELAYAITIHKSQGSEYPAVILPLLSGPQMLLNRNLLYTAVTRARKCVTVVGNEETFAEMIRNEKQQKRYSALDERIRELSETTGDNNTDGEE